MVLVFYYFYENNSKRYEYWLDIINDHWYEAYIQDDYHYPIHTVEFSTVISIANALSKSDRKIYTYQWEIK